MCFSSAARITATDVFIKYLGVRCGRDGVGVDLPDESVVHRRVGLGAEDI